MRVLSEFRPFLRFLEAYNSNISPKNDWRHILHSVIYTFLTTVISLLIVVYFVLTVWYLIETNANLKMFAVAVPMMATFVQIELTFIAMIIKNRTITDTINQLQRVIDQRKLFVRFPLQLTATFLQRKTINPSKMVLP